MSFKTQPHTQTTLLKKNKCFPQVDMFYMGCAAGSPARMQGSKEESESILISLHNYSPSHLWKEILGQGSSAGTLFPTYCPGWVSLHLRDEVPL